MIKMDMRLICIYPLLLFYEWPSLPGILFSRHLVYKFRRAGNSIGTNTQQYSLKTSTGNLKEFEERKPCALMRRWFFSRFIVSALR
ncbi:hypothetical protein [Chromobacterium vaccinii]|uniref:hypothetical protein n=1 Tax=Chromobacterium vaccinii TaxID=1108595 RepID=UPI00131A33FB|nr:hypothetical protein [Chromobacterium vaccinii]